MEELIFVLQMKDGRSIIFRSYDRRLKIARDGDQLVPSVGEKTVEGLRILADTAMLAQAFTVH